MDIVVVGTGYVGLVTGTCFAEMGHQVICLDINEEKIAKLNGGVLDIYEKELEEMLGRNLESGRLHFSTSYSESIPHAQICFITVDTPIGDQGHPNMQSFDAAVASIANHLMGYCVIANKSTVPVGTAYRVSKQIQQILDDKGVSISFDVISNPEFLTEGNAVESFLKPDRVIIGIDNPSVEQLMHKLYAPFMLSHDRLLVMDVISAEMTKYAANAVLAARISLMNELALLCEEVGGDIVKVSQGVRLDSRIGPGFLWAGIGFGGSCLPKDVAALRSLGAGLGVETSMLDAVEEVNNRQKHLMGHKIIDYFKDKGGIAHKTIGVLGLSFKPETNDIRKAPSLDLIEQLSQEGANLRLFDPIAMENAKRELTPSDSFTWCSDEYDVAKEADALVLVTEWKQFRSLDFQKLLSHMKGKAFFDGRNQYLPKEMAKEGFDYISIGRPKVKSELGKLDV